jgi:uncharacterized protein (DUF2132 family)
MILSEKEKNMSNQELSRSLDGITLEALLTQMVAHYGWEKMGAMLDIKCFTSDPSIKSSLKFLRKTPWARTRVEELYLAMPN